MSGATDSGMVRTMVLVMGALVVFAFICGIAANILSGSSDNSDDPLARNALIDRIQPVGSVRTSMDELPAASAESTAMAAAPMSAEDLVNGACAACHIAGVAGAPKLGDEAAWAERREAGLDALVASVINGKGSMPARGGSTYSDEEIRLAVQHIALFPSDSNAGDDSASAEPVTATNTEVATKELPDQDSANDASDSQMASTESSGAGQAVAAAATAVALSDNIKTQVDGVCSGCHIAGVANAPKIGDKEAWQARADKGMDMLTQSVINGLNAMPPRGGSTLTDEEIPVAIEYLMSK